jgi:cation:H+ antiporter
MVLQFILLALGLALLIKGADWLVDGATALARRYHVSDLAIGLTLVAFGTSAPELVVNSFASYEGRHGIVFGNVIGSNLFNLFLILGMAGIITPLVVKSSTVWKEIPISLLAILLLFFLASDFSFKAEGTLLSRMDGGLLLLMFFLFLFYVYKQMKTDPAQIELASKNLTGFKLWLFIFLGLAGLVGGGKLVIDNAVEIAKALGVSERIIGLTIIAAGTSLPELATSVVAAIKKKADIAVGNIIGSNIFNIFLILSVSSLIIPLNYDLIFNFDLYFLAGGTILLFVFMFTSRKYKLDRWEAAVLLGLGIGFFLCQIRN